MATKAPARNDPKIIFGWCMYDWANSAYVTTVAVGLLPAYFAEAVVGPDGARIGGTVYSATALWGFVAGLASLITFLCAPVLGAIADFSAAKKRFLLTFAYAGCVFTVLLHFCHEGDVIRTLLFYLVAQVGFIGANVFYDAFLPQITDERQMDRVSGRGYAFGYVGGGLQFAIALALVAGHERLGLSQSAAARIGMMMAGLWWGAFTSVTWKYLRETPTLRTLPGRYDNWPRFVAYTRMGFSRTLGTIRRARRFRHLVLFLIAFMLYDDGIQTVIQMATIYGKDELRLPTNTLMLTLLVIQGIATLGAWLFSRIAERIGTKRAVMLTLVLWSGVVICAYFIHSAAEFVALGGVVGLVLGGSQALSRSLYGSMVPEESSAEFFGFYTIFSKFSAIWGPMVFAVIRQMTGSARNSIVSLMAFFIVGLVLLHFVDERKAREAKLGGAF